MTGQLPAGVRAAGLVVALEGAIGLVVAAVLVVLGFSGADAKVAFGTAGWFILIASGVLAAGVAVYRGRRWGRGIGVFANLLLLPVAWYMSAGSNRPEFGVPVGLVALVALGLLFSPSTLHWAASSDSAGPDTR